MVALASALHASHVGEMQERPSLAASVASARSDRPIELIERGDLSFFVRPRVQLETVRSFSDVQKLAMLLIPSHDSGSARSIHIGRKRVPDSFVREREWAYVERVGEADELVAELTKATSYMTKTRGVRRQRGAREVASGSYGIVGHGTHVHLVTNVTAYAEDATQMLLDGLRIVPRASYIAVVFNPDSKRRIHVTRDDDSAPFREPSIFDDELMDRFESRRFAPLAPDLIDHEGAELVLIGGCSADELVAFLE